MPPLGLYVHFPWCVRKCPYCDFNSHAVRDTLPEADYLAALLDDLREELARAGRRPVRSVFMGGGTPSLFSPASIEAVLDTLRREASVADDLEVTLEANPGTAEAGRFAGYRRAGVTRLSIGIQSLDDACLRALGRVHDAAEARAAVAMARTAGFDDLNLDLMYGLPGQDLAAGLQDLGAVLALAPEHVSWYELTLEPNTLFHRQPPALPDADSVADLAEAGRAMLAAGGWQRYEVSAYAQPGRRSRHNLNYWRHGDYLGVGAGAHGKLTDRHGVIERRIKQPHPRRYLAAAGPAARLLEVRRVRDAERLFEALLNGLRLVEGVHLATLARHAGVARGDILAATAVARSRGLLAITGEHLHATPGGYDFLDAVLQDLLPDAAGGAA